MFYILALEGNPLIQIGIIHRHTQRKRKVLNWSASLDKSVFLSGALHKGDTTQEIFISGKRLGNIELDVGTKEFKTVFLYLLSSTRL